MEAVPRMPMVQFIVKQTAHKSSFSKLKQVYIGCVILFFLYASAHRSECTNGHYPQYTTYYVCVQLSRWAIVR